MTKQRTLMCVDDDADVLRSLTVLLEDDFNVITTTNPLYALTVFESNPDIKVIVSDHRMPEMNGLQMLQKINLKFPKRSVFTIIYSGYSEVEGEMHEMIKARVINEFLTKSCPTKLLISTIQRGFEKVEQLSNK